MSNLLGPGTLPGNELSYYTSKQYFGIFGKILDNNNFYINQQTLSGLGIDTTLDPVALINEDRYGSLRLHTRRLPVGYRLDFASAANGGFDGLHRGI